MCYNCSALPPTISVWIKHTHKLSCAFYYFASQSEEMFVKKTGKVQIEKQILSDSQVRNIPEGGERTELYGSFQNSYTVIRS